MGRSAYRPTLENLKEYQQPNGVLYHRPSNRYYTMLLRDGQFYQRRHQIGFDGKESNLLEERVDFVIGSGNHARTYLHRKPDGTLTELPVSWYAEDGGHWGMSPGYDRHDQEEFRRIVSNECLFCHNAYPLKTVSGASSLDPAVLDASVQDGIGCQRCHGPGRNHVRLAGSGHASKETVRSAIVNPARLNRERQLEVCMQCHLETTSGPLPGAIQRYNHDVFSYQPGKPLGEFRIYFDRAGASAENDRFEIAHAAYRLRKSACFLHSEMTCTTCHDPHNIPRGAQAVEHYQKVCRTCHATTHSSDARAGTCMDCHMPKRRTEDAVHVVMTDHFIQRDRPARDLLAAIDEVAPASNRYRGLVQPYYPSFLADDADARLYEGVAQVQDQSNLQAGVAQLAKAIKKYAPDRAEFYFELGKAYLEADDKPNASRLFEQSLRHQPSFKRAQRELVAVLFANGDTARALKLLQSMAATGSRDPVLLTNLGNAYLRQGNLSQAERALQQVLQVDPESPEAMNLIGLVRTRQRDESAERFFRQAIRFDPDFAAAHNNLATYLTASGDYSQATYEFEKAIAADPTYAEAHHGYGLLLELTHSYDQALAHLQESVRLDPNVALAHSDLADLLAAGGHGQDAEAEYRKAIRADPALTEAVFGLATTLAAQGKATEAEAQAKRAVELSPDNLEAHLLFGKLLLAQGKPAEARIHLLKAADASDPRVREPARRLLTER